MMNSRPFYRSGAERGRERVALVLIHVVRRTLGAERVDGRQAGGLFPWPDAGVAELPNRSWRKVGEGCWTALTDAGGSLFWYFDGSHRNLTVADVRTDRRWTVTINRAPGFDGAEVYHPRWANHPRFLAISGPYNQGGVNQVRSGGPQSEIYLGRLSSDFSIVEAWARVTNNGAGDSYPDVWIDRARSPHPVRPAGRVGPGSGTRGAGRIAHPRAVTKRPRRSRPSRMRSIDEA